MSIYSFCSVQSAYPQTGNWKKYDDIKFSFLYPPEWILNGTRHYDNGVTETTLTNPNSSRMKVSLVYNPKDSSLDSEDGKPVALTSVLKVLEDQAAVDYINFSSTGKFPHKYSIQNHPSVSDIVDYEKVKGRTGKMLLLYSKVGDTDTIQFTFADSKRSFYKQLPVISAIIKSVIIK
jgi:hypothetical protein